MGTRTKSVGVAIAGVMAMLGIFIAGRLLLTGAAPLTGNRGLDAAFAVFFVARAALQYRRSRG